MLHHIFWLLYFFVSVFVFVLVFVFVFVFEHLQIVFGVKVRADTVLHHRSETGLPLAVDCHASQ